MNSKENIITSCHWRNSVSSKDRASFWSMESTKVSHSLSHEWGLQLECEQGFTAHDFVFGSERLLRQVYFHSRRVLTSLNQRLPIFFWLESPNLRSQVTVVLPFSLRRTDTLPYFSSYCLCYGRHCVTLRF